MRRYWAVRLGEGGKYVKDAQKGKFIAVGWNNLGDLANLTNQDDLKKLYKEKYCEQREAQIAINHGQVWNFINNLKVGDIILTPYLKKILIGKVTSNYQYKSDWSDKCSYVHRREVKWLKEIERVQLPQKLKSSMGGQLTIFNLDKHVQAIDYLITGIKEEGKKKEITGDKLVDTVKEKLFDLSPEEFEKFITHLFSLIGFEAATTRYIADKGVDVIGTLNPDGLADLVLRVQVKRVKGNIGAAEVRGIRGTLAQGEHGAIVALSGFTSQAQEESQAPNKIPIALIDGEMLVDLILKHYDELGEEYKKLIPLRRTELPLKDIFVFEIFK